MQNEIIEGTWDELVGRTDLRGRRVRITVLDETPERRPIDSAERLRRLEEFSKGIPGITHVVDDSRESIYSGTLDDPR